MKGKDFKISVILLYLAILIIMAGEGIYIGIKYSENYGFGKTVFVCLGIAIGLVLGTLNCISVKRRTGIIKKYVIGIITCFLVTPAFPAVFYVAAYIVCIFWGIFEVIGMLGFGNAISIILLILLIIYILKNVVFIFFF